MHKTMTIEKTIELVERKNLIQKHLDSNLMRAYSQMLREITELFQEFDIAFKHDCLRLESQDAQIEIGGDELGGVGAIVHFPKLSQIVIAEVEDAEKYLKLKERFES